MTDWLVPEADRRLTPNRYAAGHAYVRPVELLVLHFTAGRSVSSSAAWLCNPDAQASAHFVVGADRALQLAPLSDRTWHAGGKSSSWRGGTVNGRSIGIEIDNLGPLTAAKGAVLDPLPAAEAVLYVDPTAPTGTCPACGQPLPGSGTSSRLRRAVSGVTDAYGKVYVGPVFLDDHGRAWVPYRVETIDRVVSLVRQIQDAFPALKLEDGGPGALPRIVGHQEVDPTRKVDPGPAFPWARIRS